MKKAVIFDMDGVILDSENVWEKHDMAFFGPDIYKSMKPRIKASSLDKIYRMASEYGFKIEKSEFLNRYFQLAKTVYQEAALTEGLEELLNKLKEDGLKIGLATSSPGAWADQVMSRLDSPHLFECTVSVFDSPDVRTKPNPDSFLVAMKELGVNPSETLIVEDSLNGIKAAKASGGYVVCLTEHLPANDYPEGADKYIDNMRDLYDLIQELNRR
ncbi:MAG: HAD family phosphatase [Candidatus Saccharimonadales bacterium]